MKTHLLAKMDNLIKIQGDSVDDEYMKGCYNGMVLMRSMVDGKEPIFNTKKFKKNK